tara:strand:- start:1239 stop:1496 length:258 start_codon:yes stop_codon:yes gene_type:complete
MKFRTGKYAGLRVDHVRKIAPWYIQWVRENRPEMLRERSPVKPKQHFKSTAIKPNYEFSSKNPSPYIISEEKSYGMNFPNKDKQI